MESAVDVQCPYCCQTTYVEVGSTQNSYQQVEDCQVCCRPIVVHIQCEQGQVVQVFADRELG